MGSNDNFQLELFGDTRGSASDRSRASSRCGCSFIRRYEKTIALIIGFLATGVIAFSAGAERGKQIVKPGAAVPVRAPDIKKPLSGYTLQRGASVVSPPQPALLPPTARALRPEVLTRKEPFRGAGDPSGGQGAAINSPQRRPSDAGTQRYTIQLVTYKARSTAEKEAGLLRKSGYSVVILSRSGYNVLCAGTFSTKESAQPVLAQLKQRYNDCHVRRL